MQTLSDAHVLKFNVFQSVLVNKNLEGAAFKSLADEKLGSSNLTN